MPRGAHPVATKARNSSVVGRLRLGEVFCSSLITRPWCHEGQALPNPVSTVPWHPGGVPPGREQVAYGLGVARTDRTARPTTAYRSLPSLRASTRRAMRPSGPPTDEIPIWTTPDGVDSVHGPGRHRPRDARRGRDDRHRRRRRRRHGDRADPDQGVRPQLGPRRRHLHVGHRLLPPRAERRPDHRDAHRPLPRAGLHAARATARPHRRPVAGPGARRRGPGALRRRSSRRRTPTAAGSSPSPAARSRRVPPASSARGRSSSCSASSPRRSSAGC